MKHVFFWVKFCIIRLLAYLFVHASKRLRSQINRQGLTLTEYQSLEKLENFIKMIGKDL